MKVLVAFTLALLYSLLIFPPTAHAERPNLPSLSGRCATLRDASVTNIPTTYTTGAQLVTGIGSGYSAFEIYNGSSTLLYVSADSSAANCSGGHDNAFIPPSGSTTLPRGEQIIAGTICVRSATGSVVTTGLVQLCYR